MLNWLKQFGIFCFMDNCGYNIPPGRFEWIIGAGETDAVRSAEMLDSFLASGDRWVFGHIGYELKNSLHGFPPRPPHPTGFGDLYFFVPAVVCILTGSTLSVTGDNPQEIFDDIMRMPGDMDNFSTVPGIRQSIGREEYLEVIAALRAHIRRGDCYEINFCQEFYTEDFSADPVSVYRHLSAVSPNPFSVLYRNGDSYLLCASPERFLFREGCRIVSQPMKGTISRDPAHAQDGVRKMELFHSPKDRAENVMIVDLVRNDLSKICVPASVQVDELFGVYSFPQVYQMVSTVSGILQENTTFSSILGAMFPMGSMTGAPKHRVMQLIDRYEKGPRGIFSGSVGYFTPERDFDFNVVIRSIMFNRFTGYLSYQVGSGITFYSDPEKEWEECMLKARAIKKVLGLPAL